MSAHKTFGFASRYVNIFACRTIVADALVLLLQIHCRWSLRTTSSSTCQVDIKIGRLNFNQVYFHKNYSWVYAAQDASGNIIHLNFVHLIGVNMKKWCILQSKIKSGATGEVRHTILSILRSPMNEQVLAT
jgi:hypothetical protein